MKEMRNAYKTLVGKPEGMRPHERLRRRWKDNIKIDGREIGFASVDWIHMLRIRSSGGNEPSGSIKCGEFHDYLSVLLASQEGLCSIAS
jgi:hypothetical protein